MSVLLGFQERRQAFDHKLWPHPVPRVPVTEWDRKCLLQLSRPLSATSLLNRSPLHAGGTLSLAEVTEKVVPRRRETISLLLDIEWTLDKLQL